MIKPNFVRRILFQTYTSRAFYNNDVNNKTNIYNNLYESGL